MTAPMDFIDLKSQYAALKVSIAERMQRVLDHGQYIMGPEVAELEAKLAAYTGARHCVTVASGTEALLIALMARGYRAIHRRVLALQVDKIERRRHARTSSAGMHAPSSSR